MMDRNETAPHIIESNNYVVSASDGNHYLKSPTAIIAAKLLDLNTNISFWLIMTQLERATIAIRKLWYESFGKNIVGWGRLFRA